MIFYRRKYPLISIIVAFLFPLLCCCAPLAAYRHPELESRLKDIKIIGIVPPVVNIYELESDGALKLVDEWGKQGRQNLLQGIIENGKGKLVEMRALKVGSDDLIQTIQQRFSMVSSSIDYNKKDASYCLGAIDDVLKGYNVDALLLVYGWDEISSFGRKAQGIMTRFANDAIAHSTRQPGTSFFAEPREGITSLDIGLVDKSGTILWYQGLQFEGTYDLRKAEDAKRIIEKVLRDFPGREK